ncbi:MAG: hypothetical protein ACJAU0_001408 [Flavobacteriales bacterium]|jgi:hypothetical protein
MVLPISGIDLKRSGFHFPDFVSNSQVSGSVQWVNGSDFGRMEEVKN